MSSAFDLCLICYPYFPSQDTGRGHDRYVFELKASIENVRPDANIRVLEQGFSRDVLAAGARQFRLILECLRTKADLYHAISPVGGATAALLRKSPLVVTVHDLIPFHIKGYDRSWKHWYVRLCTKISVRRSDAIIVPYDVTKRELIRRFNIAESKVHVVNYGVDHTRYYPQRSSGTASRKILYIGEVSRSKGVDTLIKAFSIVRKSLADAELLIGGKTSRDQPALQRLCCDLALDNVDFLGYIPEEELPRYYSSATVMVFPSRCGFGLSTLEAMACGTPVIVGAALDAPEFVADAGILFDPEDPSELAAGILRILGEPTLKEELSAKAMERANTFSWDKMARETIDVYRDSLTTL